MDARKAKTIITEQGATLLQSWKQQAPVTLSEYATEDTVKALVSFAHVLSTDPEDATEKEKSRFFWALEIPGIRPLLEAAIAEQNAHWTKMAQEDMMINPEVLSCPA